MVETLGGEITGDLTVPSGWWWWTKADRLTPRSNLVTYTVSFDHVRKLFAATRRPALAA
jgi:hypothetical protein